MWLVRFKGKPLNFDMPVKTQCDIERVRRIEYEWDFGLGFAATLVFYFDSEKKSVNGHILSEANVINKLGEVFPGFMDKTDLKVFLDDAEMYGWELLWSSNKNIILL